MSELINRVRGRSIRRGWAVAVLAVALAAVAAPAFGYLARRDQPPPGPRGGLVAEKARQEVAYRTAWGEYTSIWSAPTAAGDTCTFLQVDSAPGRAFSARGGGTCQPASQRQTVPITVRVSWETLDDGRIGVLLSGALAPGSGIQRVVLQTADGQRDVASNGRYFLGQLDDAQAQGVLGGRYVVLGLNRQGDEVARVDLNQVIADATPN
jgi:hypothetical protein